MLSQSSQTQKNISEEDSSGSDAGSGVGPEPETDRFGFIVTSKCTAGSVGPPPELVRQREAKWINIIAQWDRILLKKTSKVKLQCQKGIPASLRAKCWPMLCGALDRMKQNDDLYQFLDSQSALQTWVDVIERDLDRQFPFHEMFLSKDGHGQRGLFRVLKAYTQYQPEEGYCQAQGPVAAVLLMNMPAEEAFWCLVQISKQYLPGYYSPLLEGVLFDAAMLTWVLKRTCPAAHRHLQHHGVEPLMFATDWLMCLFTRHLPFNTLLRVWDLFFCYGVRVLLQVAVVLVRRVLGRPEQRKKCQGQVETLERLRGVREEVQEEDDAFIAEVCSVPLSARDLEKQTEKELEKWRKDKPMSTFDPRHRCLGYQMVWEMARQNQKQRADSEREKGNLSVPLTRSVSTLSLSPSSLRKRWRKAGKDNMGECERGCKIVRHLSMGAKEDWRGWNEVHFKKEQRVQEEDVVSEETKPTEHSEQREHIQMDNIQNAPTEHVEDQTEQVEKRIPETTEIQSKEIEEPTKDQTLENTLQQYSSELYNQGEKTDPDSRSQVLEQHNYKNNEEEIEGKNTNKTTGKHTVKIDHLAANDEAQIEIQKCADADASTGLETEENVQLTQVDSVTAAETSPPHPETDREVSTETDSSSQEEAFKGKLCSTEPLAETDIEKEAHAPTDDDDVPVLTPENVEENTATQDALEADRKDINSEQQIDSKTEAETLVVSIPECSQKIEGTDLIAETEAEIPFSNETLSESNEVHARCSDCGAIDSERKQEKGCVVTEPSEADKEQTRAEETQTEINEGTSDTKAPAQEVTSQDEEQPHGKTDSAEIGTREEPALGQPKVLATTCAVEEKESPETAQENTVGEDSIFVSVEPTDSNADSNPCVLVTEQAELRNSSPAQSSSHPNSLSSGDVCIRKSSGYHCSRLGRRLSADLFAVPQKATQSNTNQHTEPESNPGAGNQTQIHPDVSSDITSSPSEETTDRTETQQDTPNPPKRFGLFRRLRGEQPRKNKVKGTPKMQVPKIVIQDFSDGTGVEKPAEEHGEEKLNSREKRKRQRERDRRAKEEERLRKKREKELEMVTGRERRKAQPTGKSFQVEGEKGRSDKLPAVNSAPQTHGFSAPYGELYF